MGSTTESSLTYTEYASLPEGGGYQLIGGSIVHEPAPSTVHQAVCLNIAASMSAHARATGAGRVFVAPTDVFFTETESYQPDVLFVCDARLAIIGERRIEGAPDLVVEVMSLSSAYYDLRQKREIYARNGVREYWIVDPIALQIEVLENTGGAFATRATAGPSDTVGSAVLEGFSIGATEVFRLD